MTGSMDQRGHTNTNTDNNTAETYNTISAPAKTSTSNEALAQATDSSIVLDTINAPTSTRSHEATSTSANNATSSSRPTEAHAPPTTYAAATAPRPRRSTRFSLPTSEETNELGSASSLIATGSKGKKRLHLNEEEAGSTKKPSTSTAGPSNPKGKKRASPPVPSLTSPPTLPSPGKRAKKTPTLDTPENTSTVHTTAGPSSGKGKGKGKAVARSMKKSQRPSAKSRPSGSNAADKAKKGDTAARNLIDDSLDTGDDWGAEASGSGSNQLDEDDDDFGMGDEHMIEDDENMEGEGEDDEDEDEGDDGGFGMRNPFSGLAGMSGGGGLPSRLAQLASDSGLDEATAAAVFGRGFASYGGMSSGISGRFKRLRSELHSSSSATRLSALRECSELLLVSNEDTLGGSFSITAFGTEFIAILNGKPNIDPNAPTEVVRNPDEMDEDAQLAAVLAMSAGEAMPTGSASEDEVEAQLVACRCLAHLMEALPGTGHSLVNMGAVPVLCSKLKDISYFELAEQTLSTIEKISAEYPQAIVKEGGLSAVLNYFDFFSTNVQRIAVNAAANCCKNISPDSYKMIKDVFPTLRQTLTMSDQRLVESSTLAVVRTLESYRHNASHLEGLLDLDTAIAINSLLMPSGGSPLLSPSTYTDLLRALTSSARGSAKVTINCLEAGMTSTIYQILTGVLPPSQDEDEQGMSAGGQGLAGGVADMAVLQNLAHRPKDQVEEALALIVELLPPTPKDGVFDSKAYSEKALGRLQKGKKAGKEKAPRRSSRTAAAEGEGSVTPPSDTATPGEASTSTSIMETTADRARFIGMMPYLPPNLRDPATAKEAVQKLKRDSERRLELLKEHPDLVARFVKAMVPVLVDVYAASVAVRVRTKVLTGLVKAVAFTDAESLKATLRFVPMASFLGAIISSEDNAQFVQYALQLVELLVVKLPEVYRVSFIREGVGMSIEALAAKETKASLEPKKAIDEPGSSTSAIAKPNSADDPESEYSHARDLQRLTERYSAAGGGSREFRMSEAMRHLMEADDLIDARMSSFRSKQASALQPPYLHDANIWRAKVLCEKRLFDMDGDDSNEAKIVLDKLSALVATLSKQAASEGDLYDALRDMAGHFSSTGESLSSFELLRGGVIDGLLEFVDIDGTVPSAQRRSMLYEIFAETAPASSASPMTVLVKRLHESLGRLESFDVESAFNGMIDPTRPGGSALMRTLRIKLTAEPNQDLPKHVNNLVVSIQAIAPLGALADYLRTRVLDAASLSGLGRDRLLGSAGSSSSARAILEALEGGRQARLTQPSATAATGSGSSLTPAPAPAPPSAPGSGSAPIPPWNPRTPARAGGPKSTRRRSARLSAQITGTEETGTASEATPIPGATLAPPAAGADAAAPLSSSAPNASGSGIPTLPMDLDFDEDYSDVDDEYPEEVFEEDMEDELARPQEKVVNMNVAPDGSRVEVKTPDGTRVATPMPGLAQPAATAAAAGPSGTPVPRTGGASYAGAVKTAPTDWHLQFSIGGKDVALSDTLYGVVHRSLNSSGAAATAAAAASSAGYLVPTVTVNWRKVPGPAPIGPTSQAMDAPSPASVASAIPSGLESDAPTTKILRLLRVVHALTTEARDVSSRHDQMDENLFVNNKLTAKLTRQLEEIMLLASGCLPDWASELPRHFAFLFPFETRYSFLQSTSFGYGRLLAKYTGAQQAANRGSRRNEELSAMARLPRQKVRISRAQLLESCAKVMELYATGEGILEIEYYDEIGTGLGPTLEFYTEASKQFARRALNLWRDEDETKAGDHVFHPKGLYPSPMSATDSPENQIKLHWLKVLGTFVGRAILDSRMIDVDLNKVLLKQILDYPVKRNIATLKLVDEQLARSLERLQSYLFARKEIEALPLAPSARRNKLMSLTIGGAHLSDLSLDFTVPGHGIELKPGGALIDVDDHNLEEYLELVLDRTLGSGIARQAKAFQDGFSSIIPIDDIKIFSPEELGLLIGNVDEDWSKETLEQSIKADHGYTLDSRAVKNLIDVMSSYTPEQRRAFLSFITGAPKLPIGGFRGMTPPFTVVRKPHDAPFKADDYLPSVMTCAQYLKMPDYSTREVLAKQLDRAVHEGGGSFHLS